MNISQTGSSPCNIKTLVPCPAETVASTRLPLTSSPHLKEIYLAMAIPATQLRPGMIIKHNNDLHSVFSVEHRTPGNLRAFIQAKLRNLRTGAMFEHRFRSPDPIDKIVVDEIDMEFLYSDGDDYYFMNTESSEQTHLKRETRGDAFD